MSKLQSDDRNAAESGNLEQGAAEKWATESERLRFERLEALPVLVTRLLLVSDGEKGGRLAIPMILVEGQKRFQDFAEKVPELLGLARERITLVGVGPRAEPCILLVAPEGLQGIVHATAHRADHTEKCVRPLVDNSKAPCSVLPVWDGRRPPPAAAVTEETTGLEDAASDGNGKEESP